MQYYSAPVAIGRAPQVWTVVVGVSRNTIMAPGYKQILLLQTHAVDAFLTRFFDKRPRRLPMPPPLNQARSFHHGAGGLGRNNRFCRVASTLVDKKGKYYNYIQNTLIALFNNFLYNLKHKGMLCPSALK
jgi:hypothetical protein